MQKQVVSNSMDVDEDEAVDDGLPTPTELQVVRLLILREIYLQVKFSPPSP